MNMEEIPNGSINLVVTLLPYFDAQFNYEEPV